MVQVVGFDETAKSRITCKSSNVTKPGCGAILEYTQRDVQRYDGKDYSGGADGKEWVNCPNCGREVILRSW